jgi:hypothetical protein
MKLLLLAPLVILGIVVFVAIGGQIVMQLWNWLLPPLFGFPQLTFWQALGMLALCRILFGGFGSSRSHRSHFRQRMAERMEQRMSERWEKMTPEEREKYRQSFRGRWGSCEPPESKPNA